jgi:hypothetical protein
MFSKLIKFFSYKSGKPSKTAFFLSLSTFMLLFLFVFQGLFAGVTLLGWWLVPEFNVAAATTVFGIMSALSCVNHSSLVEGNNITPKLIKDIIEKLRQICKEEIDKYIRSSK